MTLEQALWLLDGSADITTGVRREAADAIREALEKSKRNGELFRALQIKAKEYKRDSGIYKNRYESTKQQLDRAKLAAGGRGGSDFSGIINDMFGSGKR